MAVSGFVSTFPVLRVFAGSDFGISLTAASEVAVSWETLVVLDELRPRRLLAVGSSLLTSSAFAVFLLAGSVVFVLFGVAVFFERVSRLSDATFGVSNGSDLLVPAVDVDLSFLVSVSLDICSLPLTSSEDFLSDTGGLTGTSFAQLLDSAVGLFSTPLNSPRIMATRLATP